MFEDMNDDTVSSIRGYGFSRKFKLPWDAFFEEIGLRDWKTMQISYKYPKMIRKLATLLHQVPLSMWKTYLYKCYSIPFIKYLGKPFDDLHFSFFGTFLQGQEKPTPKHDLFLNFSYDMIPHTLSRRFWERCGDQSIVDGVEEIAKSIQRAAIKRMRENSWLSTSSKVASIEKIRAITYKIGRPAQWEPELDLELDPKNFLKNRFLLGSHAIDTLLDRLGTKHTYWEEGLFRVNAYYYSEFKFNYQEFKKNIILFLDLFDEDRDLYSSPTKLRNIALLKLMEVIFKYENEKDINFLKPYCIKFGISDEKIDKYNDRIKMREQFMTNKNKFKYVSEEGKETDCGICYENKELIVFDCLGHYMCVDCYLKVSKCPFCSIDKHQLMKIRRMPENELVEEINNDVDIIEAISDDEVIEESENETVISTSENENVDENVDEILNINIEEDYVEDAADDLEDDNDLDNEDDDDDDLEDDNDLDDEDDNDDDVDDLEDDNDLDDEEDDSDES
jgi:hypothetical protein